MPHLPNIHEEADGKTPPTSIPLAIGLMCGAGLLFGISSALLKGFSVGLPPMECAFFRCFVGFALIVGMSVTGIKKTGIGTRKGILFLRGLLGGIAALAYLWSVQRMDLGLANGLNQTSPIFVCIFAAIFLKERFSWHIYALVLLSFAGIALILKPDVSGVNPVMIAALVSGVLSGLAYTCIRVLRRTESPETIIMWLFGMTCLMALATAVYDPWMMPNSAQFGGLLLTGLTAFGGQLLMTRAYRYAAATIVAPFIYMSTFSSIIIAFVIWNELPGVLALCGCALVVLSSVLIGVFSGKEKKV